MKNWVYDITIAGAQGQWLVVEVQVCSVLQVETNLQFPTKYHMQQNKKRQIQMFLNQGQVPVTVQSLPAVSSTSAPGDLGFLGSAPADPDSPLSMGLSSVATSTSEVSFTTAQFVFNTINHLVRVMKSCRITFDKFVHDNNCC